MVDVYTPGAVIPDVFTTYQAEIPLIVCPFTSSVIYIRHENEFNVLSF